MGKKVNSLMDLERERTKKKKKKKKEKHEEEIVHNELKVGKIVIFGQ